MLAACAPVQQAATSPDYHKTRTGAGIGAGVGAVIGLLTKGDKFDNALIGAALGGIAGGAVGNYQDRQEAQLKQSMAGTGVEVVRKQDNITLDMPGGITFATNSSDLNAAIYPILDKVALSLNQYDQTMVEVAGHTDSTGSASYNQALSLQARAVGVGVPGQPRRALPAPDGGRGRRESSGRLQRHARRAPGEPARGAHHRAGDAGPARHRAGAGRLSDPPQNKRPGKETVLAGPSRAGSAG